MLYEALCLRVKCRFNLADPMAYDGAAMLAAAHHAQFETHKTIVAAVCPNCEQWRHNGDCMNECASKGLAPKASPETHGL